MSEPTTTPTIEEIKEAQARITRGEWMLQDSCSWRRIGTAEPYSDGNVVCPVIQRGDNHPDLLAKREDLQFIANAPRYVDFLLSEVDRLKAEKYPCPHWDEPPIGTPIEILDKLGHALSSLTSQDIDAKGKEVWRYFWQLDDRLRNGERPHGVG